MKAKNREIRDVLNVLCGINISKVAEMEVKTILYNDYLHFRKVVREIASDEMEIKEKFRADFPEEFKVVGDLRRAGQPVEGHEEFLAAEEAAISCINKKWDEESEVSPKLIPFDTFSRSVKTDLTLEQVAVITGFVIE